MNKKQALGVVLWAALLLLYYGCANQANPSGGPKDNTPPQLLEAIPPNKSIHFNSDRIVLKFDEFTKINNPSQILISPPLRNKPDFKIKKKTVVIELNDTLRSNTTYMLNFGESIVDITEGNKAKNFVYVFSTGDYVDSLSISGKVVIAKDLQVEEGILVMLYPELEDSVPYQLLPYYFTKTKASGAFDLNYLKPGQYKLFALSDQNVNYLFDQPTEMVAFCDTPITIDTFPRKYDLSLFLEAKDEPIELLNASTRSIKQIRLAFTRNADSVQVNTLLHDDRVYHRPFELNENKDTVIVWLKDPSIDTFAFELRKDGIAFDTAKVFKKTMSLDTLRKLSSLGYKHNIAGKMDIKGAIEFKFKHPIASFVDTAFHLFEDTSRRVVKPVLTFKDSLHRSLQIDYEWKPGMSYELIIDSAAYYDIYGLTVARVKFRFTIKTMEEYSKIIVTLDSLKPEFNYIVQLLDANKHVSRETFLAGTDKNVVEFTYLSEGKYDIQVIEDRNKNKKWDTGKYLEKRQPEKVFKYGSSADLKPNWEMELDMSLYGIKKPAPKP